MSAEEVCELPMAMSPGRPDAPQPQMTSVSIQRIGMPQLGYAGLSLRWLLAECGDRHWHLIEKALEQPSVKWQDGKANRLYASFVAVEVTGELALFTEGAQCTFSTTLERTGRSLFESGNELRCERSSAVLRVVMSSVFVRRAKSGDNGSFEASGGEGTLLRGSVPTRRRSALLEKREKWTRHTLPSTGRRHTLEVVPHEDYNGAGMVYFASFATLADRAARKLGLNVGGCGHQRRLYFYSNVNGDDSLVCAAISGSPDTGATALGMWSLADGRLVCVSEEQRTPHGDASGMGRASLGEAMAHGSDILRGRVVE